MSKYAHKGQILPITNQMIPIDKETTFHASYDYDLNGFNQGDMVYPDGQEWVSYFNGADTSFISHGNISFGTGDSWTAEAWVQYDRIAQWAFFLGDDTSSAQAICIHPTDAMLTFRASDSVYVIGPAIPNPANWNHLCVTYSNGTITFYINGIPSAPQTKSSVMNFNNIGWAYTNIASVKVFQGQMSEVRIWNVAKDKSEIEKMMSTKMSGNETGLVGYWRLSEREGSISFDSSNNKNDGRKGVGISSSRGSIVATLKKDEGKFRGAVLVEPDTTNLAPYSDYSNYPYGELQGIGGWGGDTGSVIYYPSGGYKNLAYRKVIKTTAGDGGVYRDEHLYINIEDNKTYTVSGWMKANQNVSVEGYALCINRPSDNAYRVGPVLNLTTEWKRYSWIYKSGVGHAGDYVHRGIIYTDENLPVDIYWCGFQVEEREGATSYVNGTRPLGKLWYPKELVSPSAFTLSCWFNIPYMHRVATNNGGINTNWFHPIMEIATPTTSSQSFGLVAGPEPSSYSRKLTLQAPVSGASTFPVQDNTWYHMVTTYDGTTYKVYIDGVERISAAGPPMVLVEGQHLMVGGGYRGKPNIMIDELRIESRAISLEEVEAWAASGLHYSYLDYSQHVD